MRLSSFLHYGLNRLTNFNNSIFSFSIAKQQQYVNHFLEPEDDFERAYDQYCCQMKLNRWKAITLVLNVVSLPIIIFYLLKPSDKVKYKKEVNSIFFSDGKPQNIIPDILIESAGFIELIENKKELFTKEDRIFFNKLFKRYPLSWHFLLKCLMKIRYYSYQIEALKPERIIVCNEYSFTCTALTRYCRCRNILHINVMHGEKLFYMRDSFFRFDKCYIWDEYYKNLFCRLRADKDQFIVAIPPSLLFDKSFCREKEIDYIYYLGNERGDTLEKIIQFMNIIKKKRNLQVAVRPHPRYTNKSELETVAINIIIEDTSNISIEKSILRAKNVISSYSTVLNQAYHNGVSIIIDDISQPEQFKRLKELNYIMFEKEHKLLSEVLENIK